MLVWKRILWLREHVREQRAWIRRCGGDLAGYIAHYGDQGVPPLDAHGTPCTFRLTSEQEALFDHGFLSPVPGTPGLFYKPHFGAGGTAIYEADINRLRVFERELSELEISCWAARQKADQMEGTVTVHD